MITREEAVAACLAFPLAYEDHPFEDTNWTLMRHRQNRKTFAAVFAREGRIWINVKALPMAGDLWRRLYPAVVPGYHMNKNHWVSIILDGSMEDADILRLIEDSFRLTAPKPRKRRTTMEDIRTALYARTGGFMKGICHPDTRYTELTGTGFGWVRRDAPYPFDENGELSSDHLRFLEETRIYAENGLRSVVISPYPRAFLAHGIDPRTAEGLAEVRRVCRFMAEAYRGLGVCWQATNEMFVVHFRAPLTIGESVEFLVASLTGLREGDPDAAVGHNTVSTGDGWDELCKDIARRTRVDYLGFDLYNGTWGDGDTDTYIERIDALYALFGMPIVLMEFGFNSSGGNAHADRREEAEYLASRGFSGWDDVMSRPEDFIAGLSAPLVHTARTCAPADLENAFRGMIPHLTRLWFAEMTHPHTEEGQAAFYGELLPKLLAHPHLAGAFVYCWQDSASCFTCGASDCPCETTWGITRSDGSMKPAREVIRGLFGK